MLLELLKSIIIDIKRGLWNLKTTFKNLAGLHGGRAENEADGVADNLQRAFCKGYEDEL